MACRLMAAHCLVSQGAAAAAGPTGVPGHVNKGSNKKWCERSRLEVRQAGRQGLLPGSRPCYILLHVHGLAAEDAAVLDLLQSAHPTI